MSDKPPTASNHGCDDDFSRFNEGEQAKESRPPSCPERVGRTRYAILFAMTMFVGWHLVGSIHLENSTDRCGRGRGPCLRRGDLGNNIKGTGNSSDMWHSHLASNATTLNKSHAVNYTEQSQHIHQSQAETNPYKADFVPDQSKDAEAVPTKAPTNSASTVTDTVETQSMYEKEDQGYISATVPATNSEEDLEAERPTKYLLYWVESGWANQALSLEKAFYLARVLNRTLILPSVMPHLGKGGTMPVQIFGVDSGKFKTSVDPKKYFVKKLPSKKYLPIEDVLDLDFSLPQVPFVDAKEFFSSEESTNMTRWVLEHDVSHFNTKWIRERPDLKGTQETMERTEYGFPRTLNMEYREIAKAATHPADILTFLDSFKAMFHESAMDPIWHPRMSQPIRETAEHIREDWHVPSYASIHIRGGDGPFKKEAKLNHTIITAMEGIYPQLEVWLNDNAGVSDVGLYVATDCKDLFNNTLMIEKTTELVNRIQERHQTTVTILSGRDFGNVTSASLPELRYASMFMDIQLAACATIGYVGTEGSTFSSLIDKTAC